ncbi:MAG: type I 3-dehydroquinate dehydratase [Victivallaceae bacterium]
MLCISTRNIDFSKILRIAKQNLSKAQLIEVGYKSVTEEIFPQLKQFVKQSPLPLILKPLSETTKDDYIKTLLSMAQVNSEYIDLEVGNFLSKQESLELAVQIKRLHPRLKIIFSYHDFNNFSSNLDTLYKSLLHPAIHFYKIAVHVSTSIEALRILNYSKDKKDLITIGLGESGHITRILGRVINNPITYCCLDESLPIAPGQLSLNRLLKTYHFNTTSDQTSVYCLIGNPVNRSVSHITHNEFFRKKNIDAVYVKLNISKQELPLFLQEAVKLPFKGISITTPLKIELMRFIPSENHHSLNTLKFENNRFYATNTDGIGVLKSLQKAISTENKSVAVIGGSGGSGLAVIKKLLENQAIITVIGRKKPPINHFLSSFDFQYFQKIPLCRPYDILINCTPIDFSVPNNMLKPTSIVLDLKTIPKTTLFLKNAVKANCKIIYGTSVFTNQAIEQFKFWQLPIRKFEAQFEQIVQNAVSSRKMT